MDQGWGVNKSPSQALVLLLEEGGKDVGEPKSGNVHDHIQKLHFFISPPTHTNFAIDVTKNIFLYFEPINVVV